MFQECTNLKNVGNINANSVGEYGCEGMFNGDESIVSPPELNIENLSKRCYNYMFAYCTNLKYAPELGGGKILAPYCYANMFYGCRHLEESVDSYNSDVVIYNAASLAVGCYELMFYDCRSIKRATINQERIKDTDNCDGCYSWMFSGCTSLCHIRFPYLNYFPEYLGEETLEDRLINISPGEYWDEYQALPTELLEDQAALLGKYMSGMCSECGSEYSSVGYSSNCSGNPCRSNGCHWNLDGDDLFSYSTHWYKGKSECNTAQCCSDPEYPFDCLDPTNTNNPPCNIRSGIQLGEVQGKNKEIACIIHYTLWTRYRKENEPRISNGVSGKLKWVTDFLLEKPYYVCYSYDDFSASVRKRLKNDRIEYITAYHAVTTNTWADVVE
jgi:hypothetical protein